jgi:lysophospholipase L1-like esterase
LQLVAPYRSDETVRRGIAVTRAILKAAGKLAESREATPLVLVLQVGPEDHVEQALRHRILDGLGLQYVLVEIDPAWRLSDDVHPNAHAARVIADAVAARLKPH